MEADVTTVLRTHRHQLLERLQPGPVADLLLSSRVLSPAQHQRIQQLPTRKAACGRLITDLEKAGASGYRHFLQALQETGQQELTSKLPSVLETSPAHETPVSQPSPPLNQRCLSSESSKETQHLHQRIIRQNLTALKENIDIKYSGLYDKLVEKGVLSRGECKVIKDSSPSGMEQIGTLLETMETKSVWDFAKFSDALTETNQQPVVDRYLQGGAGMAEHLEGIKRLLALHYQRNLSRYPIYRYTDNPKMADMRRLYTPTQFVDLTDWPPLPTGRPYEDYHLLFSKSGAPTSRVLLLGTPGMGKSMLSWKLALDWADDVQPDTQASQGSDATAATTERLQKELVLFIDLSRVRRQCSLVQIFSEQFLISKDDAQTLTDYVSIHGDHCGFILDGWDEYEPSFCDELTQIANGALYNSSTLLITSRIRDQALMPQNTDKMCQTIGFSIDRAQAFMRKVLEIDGSGQKCEKLIDSITNQRLWDIFCVPYMINQMCMLQYDNLDLQDNVTDLYVEIVKSRIYYETLKGDGKATSASVKQPLEKYRDELTTAGKVALSGLTKPNAQTVFNLESLSQSECDVLQHLGVGHRIDSASDPLGARLYTFGHKSIQEFLASIYIVHCEAGKAAFQSYLISLKEVYDSQLLIKFICGLSLDIANVVTKKVQMLTKQCGVTAAECPGFSTAAWKFKNPTSAQTAYLHTKSVNAVEPFLISCCGEVRNKSSSFPYSLSQSSLHLKINPNLNFMLVNPFLLSRLLQMGRVAFHESSSLQLCDLLLNQAYDQYIKNILSFIPRTAKLIFLRHIECIPGYMLVLTENIFSLQNIVALRIMSLSCQADDMKILLKHLKIRVTIKRLELRESSMTGCEADLCECISHLVNLIDLSLRSLCLSDNQAALCQAISHLHQLLMLDLSHTDLSAAGGALSCCIQNLTKLRYLNLNDSHLTVDQTRQVLSCLPASCPDLMYLNMSHNPVAKAASELLACTNGLHKLERLAFRDMKLMSKLIVSLFEHMQLHTRIKYLGCIGAPVDEGISGIIPLLSKVPQLQYLCIASPTSPAASTKVERLRAACRVAGTMLVVGKEEYKQHAVGIQKLSQEIQSACRTQHNTTSVRVTVINASKVKTNE